MRRMCFIDTDKMFWFCKHCLIFHGGWCGGAIDRMDSLYG